MGIDVATGFPACRGGGSLPPGPYPAKVAKVYRAKVARDGSVGLRARLYGRQDARRYGAQVERRQRSH